MTLPLMASAARIWKRSNTSSIRQKPTRFPYSCHAQFGTSGIGAPPAGGVRTVRGMVSRGFHSSTFTITHTTRRAPLGSTSRGRSFIAEYEMRSVGSIVTSPFSRSEYVLASSVPREAVHAHRCVVEHCGAFTPREALSQLLELVPEDSVRTRKAIDREVALEHATPRTEVIDH